MRTQEAEPGQLLGGHERAARPAAVPSPESQRQVAHARQVEEEIVRGTGGRAWKAELREGCEAGNGGGQAGCAPGKMDGDFAADNDALWSYLEMYSQRLL